MSEKANKLKISLIIFFVAIAVLLICFIWVKQYKKSKSSGIIWTPTSHNYRFKSHEAEQLSISAFDLKNDGYYDKAIKLYYKAIKLEYDNPKLYFDLSDCYARKKEYQKAILSLNSAIIFDSTYAGFYSNRGLYYYHLCEDEKAIEDLEKAVKLDSTSPNYYYNLSITYYAADSLNKACDAFKKAKILGLNIERTKSQKQFTRLQELCK